MVTSSPPLFCAHWLHPVREREAFAGLHGKEVTLQPESLVESGTQKAKPDQAFPVSYALLRVVPLPLKPRKGKNRLDRSFRSRSLHLPRLGPVIKDGVMGVPNRVP